MSKSVLASLAVAGLSIFTTSNAFAQSATATIGLNAFVNALCTINGSALDTAMTGTVVTSGTSASAQTLALTSSGSYTVACTTPNAISVTSANDGIKANTPGVGTNIMTYTATVRQGLTSTVLATLGTTPGRSATNATPAAFNGAMTVGITMPAFTNLSPGTYADTLTVTLTPQ